MALTEPERRVLAAVDPDALVRDAAALVRVPSVTGDEAAAQAVVAELAAGAGLDVDTWELDVAALERAPGFPGREAERERAVGVAATLGAGKRTLVLNGHVDVVPPGTAPWARDPWSGAVADGRLHGRGACDMKGGLVCGLHALRAVRAAGIPLDGRAVLQSVVGEEDGGLGTFDALHRIGRVDAAVIPEPSRLELVVAQAGALTFQATVRGRAAHAATRLEGDSAIDRFTGAAAVLAELERGRNADVAHPLMAALPLPYPISIGRVEGGEWASTVPDRVVFAGRAGVRVGEAPEAARAAVEAALDGLAEVAWTGGAFAPGETAADHPFVGLVRAAAADVLGAPPALAAVPYGADLRQFTTRGVPTVILGPGDVRAAHTADESIAVAELVAATRAFALIAARFLTP